LNNFFEYPHRRQNILTGEWVLVSPHRTKRPWNGAEYALPDDERPEYVPDCYLCPGNKRANGEVNPLYKKTFAFTNDFSALLPDAGNEKLNEKNLLIAKAEKGICRVVNFSPKHNLTLAEMKKKDIEEVIMTWRREFEELGSRRNINYVQIFENKGALMGNSNSHPHCQIWAQSSMPMEALKEQKKQAAYYRKSGGKSLLADYAILEAEAGERVVFRNASFIVVVPFWAVWPFETIIIPFEKFTNILELGRDEIRDFAEAIKVITSKYDRLFNVSFPYSSGIHQAPTDGKKHDEWRMHMHFYPPLLRSATIKKFMVGYELLAEPQRDLTPEYCAGVLKKLPAKGIVVNRKKQIAQSRK
jgi:UDPglucose--hexose-1-phosphate uridylyltransferase